MKYELENRHVLSDLGNWFSIHNNAIKIGWRKCVIDFTEESLFSGFISFFLVAVFSFSSHLSVWGQSDDPSNALFDMERIARFQFEMSEGEWKKLQPPEGVDWDIEKAFARVGEDVMSGNKAFRNGDDARAGLAGYFGINHQYGSGVVTVNGESLKDVGIRYKGNGTFWAGHLGGKYSFKIYFSEYVKGQEFYGLKKINLNNEITDPSMLREPLSYYFFRSAGVPASRTGWARVSLTRGKGKPVSDLGLYVSVEQVDKRFLKRHFGSSKGLLLKPSCFGAFCYLGEKWEPYETAYGQKTEGTAAQRQRVIEFSRLIHRANDATFEQEIEKYLDMDAFYSFLSANVILSNLDSFLAGTQNYYAYLNPSTERIQFIPWDLDSSMGAFTMVGNRSGRRKLSIDEPQVGDGANRLIERVLGVPRFRKAYRDRLTELLHGPFSDQSMSAALKGFAGVITPYFQQVGGDALEEFERTLYGKPSGSGPDPLSFFINARRTSLQKQLDGKSNGERVKFNDPGALTGYFLSLVQVGIIAFLVALLNLGAWVWGVIAGFRRGAGWGILNLVFYPVAPLLFGFFVCPDKGRRSAWMCLISTLLTILVVIASSLFFPVLVELNS